MAFEGNYSDFDSNSRNGADGTGVANAGEPLEKWLASADTRLALCKRSCLSSLPIDASDSTHVA